MKAQCVQAVTQALGRPLLKGEAEAIEQRIRDQMRQLARTDANWQSYSGADRLKMAGEAAGRQLQAEAALKRQRVALQIAAADARLADMRDYAAARPGRTLFDGLAEVLRQIDVAVTGIQRETMTRLMDLLEAAQPGFMRLTGDPQFAKDVVFEAFGRSTGNKAAAAGARVWLQESEGLRARFNRAGGDVGKLDYAYFPQPHDGVRMIKAGRQAWVDAILPKLDRSRYVDETGARLDDATMRAILDEAFETITTDGRNKLQPGEIPPGVSGVMANRGSQSRAIHFAGPDEYLSYMTDFGRGSVFEGMMSHVRNMSLNIAMVERMGPNAKANFELLHDTARQTGAADQMRWQQWKVSTRDLWNTLSGKQGQVYNGGEVFVNRAQFWQNMRNWQVFAKLQGTLFSAITDVPTYYVTSGYNRAGFLETTHALLKAFIPGAGSTDMANRMGIVSESLTQDMSRWGTELLRDGWTGRLANQTMRVSLLNMWTDALRRASGLAVMGALGRMNKTAWGSLEESDRLRLSEQGITERVWRIMQLAKPEDWGGSMMITPEAIRAIPDADLLAGPVSQAADAQRTQALASVAELTARNQQEHQWLAKRLAGYKALENRLAQRLNRFVTSTDATARQAAQFLDAQRDLLAARVERAEAEADIDAYLVAQRGRNAQVGALEALRRGQDSGLQQAFRAGAQAQRTGDAVAADARMAAIGERADARAEAAADRLAAAGDRTVASAGRVGERLGERRGRAQARVAELERRVKQAEREADAAVRARYEDMRGDLQSALDELDAWYVRMDERVQRREAVIDRITRDIPKEQAALAQRARDDAATRLVGMLVDESEYSSLAPDLFTRSRVEAFGQRGTVNGELARTFFLFKSFPMGLISRHWTRAAEQWTHGDGVNRVAYAAGLFGGMTLFGGVSVMLKDILAGRDPRDPVDPKFWLAASSQGGGLSFLGDAMLGMAGSGSQVGGQNSASAVGSAILGPVFGAAIEGLDVTIGNASQALRGKDSKFGAEALRYVRANLPFVNLWYVRTVLDRAIMHDLQEQLSPGYLSKMRERARRNYGTDFWWQPGELAPDRAPELTIGGG